MDSDGEESRVQTTTSEQMQRLKVAEVHRRMCARWRGQEGWSTSHGL